MRRKHANFKTEDFIMFEYILMVVPVVFLIVSVLFAYKTVSTGRRSRKRAVLSQILAFAAVSVVTLITAMTVFAAEPEEAAKPDNLNLGISMIAAALATGISGIGGGLAVGGAAPAAIGATSEDPKAFGKALIFVALGEGVALYGLLVSILIISKV